MNGESNPLGRYDEGVSGDERLHEVRLLDLPVQVLVAAREHHDEVMREFTVLAVSDHDQDSSVPQRLVALTEILGARYGASAGRPDRVIDEAVQRGDRVIDVTYQVPGHVVEAADRLESLMAEADEFCRTEQMLTLPRSELLVQFAHWYLEEFRRQVGGGPPRRWDGRLRP